MRKYGWLLLATLPLLIAAGVWWLIQRPADTTQARNTSAGSARSSPIPTRAEMASLRTQAENACRCARQAGEQGSRSACWREFDQALSRFPHSEAASACVPLSTTLVCFGDGMANCVVRDRGGGACTAEEARVIDAIWAEETRRNASQQGSDRANRRIAEAVQAFSRGERVTAPRVSGGCMG